jgi:hypothetical protein
MHRVADGFQHLYTDGWVNRVLFFLSARAELQRGERDRARGNLCDIARLGGNPLGDDGRAGQQAISRRT